jgi:uncharacterized damage-inducible protein DinB
MEDPMRKLALYACCAVLLATVPGLAQSGNAMTDAMKAQFAIAKGDLTKTAEQVTEANYAFKPTPEVRSLGAIIGHVADSNYYFCSAASGAANPMKDTSVEKTKTSKADLQKALADSLAFCDTQLGAMTDAKGAEMVDFFGGKQPRLAVFAFNTAHNFEHYGNLVTYMRLKGMVPPSSQKGSM